MKRKFRVVAKIIVDVGSPKKAEKMAKILNVECKVAPTQKFNVNVSRKGKNLTLVFKASNLTALRASINSFCGWANMLNNVFNVLSQYS
ncbi:MAG: hypothetical protein DRO36_03785 [Candidatus Hecatellales archaeon]|nr:MAG: hypothetical protein DRO36_03785 [Candidatus Hecatellales archaeon]